MLVDEHDNQSMYVCLFSQEKPNIKLFVVSKLRPNIFEYMKCSKVLYHVIANISSLQMYNSLYRFENNCLFQKKARDEGLWNLFLPLETDRNAKYGAGLSNVEYAFLAEEMGKSLIASEVSGFSGIKRINSCLSLTQ